VEGSGNGYLRTAGDHVHLNPVRAKLLAPDDRLLAYPWSSFPLYLAAPEHRPRWLRADRLLGQHGIAQGTPAGRQDFERHPERRRLEEVDVAEELARLRWTVKQVAERLRLGKPKGARTNLHKFMNRSGAGGSQPQFDLH
jgi:hypothetical protein